MQTWTKEELDSFCKQAIELLKTKKKLAISFKECWIFSNSVGGNFHVRYHNEYLNTDGYVCRNIKILQDLKIVVDEDAGLNNIQDIKQKIILRIAYFIFKDYQREMRLRDKN